MLAQDLAFSFFSDGWLTIHTIHVVTVEVRCKKPSAKFNYMNQPSTTDVPNKTE